MPRPAMLRVGQVLSCRAGHPVWQLSMDDAMAAVLDLDWLPPDREECCLFCGPAGRSRRVLSTVGGPDPGRWPVLVGMAWGSGRPGLPRGVVLMGGD